MISCVVFDFDDTLVWSEKYKRQAFFDIAEEFEGGLERMTAIFKDPNRGDRFKIMQTFAKSLGYDNLSEKLSNKYTTLVEEHIKCCESLLGTEEALTYLKTQDIRLYINSATPEESLRKTIKNRGWENFFQRIYGGHDQKVENLKKIADLEKIAPYNIVMVGDGDNDRQAAEDFGCFFIGLHHGYKKYKKPVKITIKDMTELVQLITEADFEQ